MPASGRFRVRVGLACVHGTDLGAGAALGTEFRVYCVRLALCYGPFGALRQADPACNAIF